MTTAKTAGHPWATLLKYTTETLPPIKQDGARLAWPDIAKGASIAMVVYWHMVDDVLKLNEALTLLRMPLFFFVAGLFIRSTFAQGNEGLFVHRVLNFAWLYILWACIMFVMLVLPYNLFMGNDWYWSFPSFHTLIVEPPPTLWFIYALCLAVIITMVTRKVPLWILFSIAIGGYLWSAMDQNLRDPDFYTRMVRLYPFFLIGLVSLNLLDALGQKLRPIAVFLLPGFCLLAYALYFSGFRDVSWLTFLVSLFGVVSLIATAQWLQGTPIGNGLAWIGAASLHIYLLHRFFWAYLGLPLMELGKYLHSEVFTVTAMSMLAGLAIVASGWAGPRMARHPRLAFLFAMPRGLLAVKRKAV